jgi:hypothetical protein
MGFYPSNCNIIESHYACGGGGGSLACTAMELARVRSVALIHKTFYNQLMSDPEDSSIWLAGITAGLIIVLPQTQGDYNGGDAINGRGFGYSEETLTAYGFVVNYKDPDYVGNLPHYNSITGSRNFYIAFCSETVMRISQRPGNLVATNPIANSLKDEVNYMVTYKWTHNKMPLEYNIPDNVFVCAPGVVYGASFDNSFNYSFDTL